MPAIKELLPEGPKNYVKLMLAKFRHRDCFIGSPMVSRSAALGNGCSIAAGVEIGERVAIGSYSYVNRGTIIASGSIGRYCSVGPYALIGMPEHPSHYLSTSPYLYGPGNLLGRPSNWNDFPAPPEIGNDVWIGAFSFVRQSIRIGDGAIIGAGAVVTRDVAAYEVVAGVPARRLRSRFGPPVVNWLLESSWTDRDPRDLSSIAELFERADWDRVLMERSPADLIRVPR